MGNRWVGLFLALAACGDDDGGTTPPRDAGATDDAITPRVDGGATSDDGGGPTHDGGMPRADTGAMTDSGPTPGDDGGADRDSGPAADAGSLPPVSASSYLLSLNDVSGSCTGIGRIPYVSVVRLLIDGAPVDSLFDETLSEIDSIPIEPGEHDLAIDYNGDSCRTSTFSETIVIPERGRSLLLVGGNAELRRDYALVSDVTTMYEGREDELLLVNFLEDGDVEFEVEPPAGSTIPRVTEMLAPREMRWVAADPFMGSTVTMTSAASAEPLTDEARAPGERGHPAPPVLTFRACMAHIYRDAPTARCTYQVRYSD